MTETTTTATLGDIVADNIPKELREKRIQWVNWKYVWDGKRWTKHPYNPRTGSKASSTDALTWSTFEDVYQAYEEGKYDGVGFVFSTGDPFTGIDLDRCRDPESGEISKEAQRIIDTLDGYVEVSPSGKGIHIIVRGKVPRGRKRDWIEVYSCERYLTVTGRVL